MRLSRRRFLRVVGGGAAAGVGLGVLGWRVGGGLPRVAPYDLVLRDLPAAFEGFRLVLISDVHAGPHMDRPRMADVVRFVNTLEADLIVLGGDMVDRGATAEDMRAFGDAFRALRAPHGVVAVPGNHEHFAGIDPATRAFERAGATLLRDGCHTIGRMGSELAVLGVDDPGVLTFDPPQEDAVSAVSAMAPSGALPILIAHRPAAFDAAAKLGIPLTLSGHTHGGQIGLSRDLTPVRLATRYVRGHYQRDGCHLIVSSGVGTSGPPLRLGVPPSVAVVTLRVQRSYPGSSA